MKLESKKSQLRAKFIDRSRMDGPHLHYYVNTQKQTLYKLTNAKAPFSNDKQFSLITRKGCLYNGEKKALALLHTISNSLSYNGHFFCDFTGSFR